MTELASSLRARSTAAAPLARTFYIFEAILMSVIVIAGFLPYYADLPRANAPRHWIVHIHGAAFTGWLGLLIAQTALVYRRDVRTHRRLGVLTAAYAAVLVVLGAAVMIVAPVEHIRAGEWTMDEAAGFLVLPIGDLLLFIGFFAAALYYRRVPATHKRLMLLASNALIFPGAARFGDPSIPMIFGLWYLPIVLAMAFDQFTTGRVHRVYYIGVAVMLLFFARVVLMTAEPWLAAGRAILEPFL